MNATDVIFAVLAAGALTLALRALLRMLGAAWGLERDDGEVR